MLGHGASAWYTPAAIKGHQKGVAKKLRFMQGQSLRVVAGAYRATATEALEMELHVSPIDLHMEKIVARAMTRMDSRTA